MYKSTSLLIPIVALFLYYTPFTNAVEQCYHCRPNSGNNCSDPVIHNCRTYEGDVKNYVCETYITRRHGFREVVKGCLENVPINIRNCRKRNDEYMEYCETCDSDLCNRNNSAVNINIGTTMAVLLASWVFVKIV